MRSRIEEQRVIEWPDLERIIVGVDPATTDTETSDETGIVVCGRGTDLLGYLLDDLSMKGKPNTWGRAVVAAYYKYKANMVVAEVNQGGDMVESTIHTIDPTVPVLKIHAKKNKQARAEPISALHEQGRIYHVGFHAKVEDQLCEWVPEPGVPSPDRLDAYVYALTELMLGMGRPKFMGGDDDDEETVEQTIKRQGVFWPT